MLFTDVEKIAPIKYGDSTTGVLGLEYRLRIHGDKLKVIVYNHPIEERETHLHPELSHFQPVLRDGCG